MSHMQSTLLSFDRVRMTVAGGWWRTKILRAADAFYARRREGPYRFIQNRPGTSIVALKSDTAAEKSKDQLSRDFSSRSIFDFCNNIDPQQNSRSGCLFFRTAHGCSITTQCLRSPAGRIESWRRAASR
jgi:hypothetical protein